MEEALQAVYERKTSAYERHIKIIENRLQFLNWMFGISSGCLFISISFIGGIEVVPSVVLPIFFVSIASISAVLAIFITYSVIQQGHKSIENVNFLLTYLDLQATIFLKDPPPSDPHNQMIDKFAGDEYLKLIDRNSFAENERLKATTEKHFESKIPLAIIRISSLISLICLLIAIVASAL